MGRVKLARGLFAYLARTRRNPSALPDTFYARVNAVLGGRFPDHKIVRTLLASRSTSPARDRTG